MRSTRERDIAGGGRRRPIHRHVASARHVGIRSSLAWSRYGYRPQLFIGATDVTATLAITELAPGAHTEVDLALDRAVAIEAGVRFALREVARLCAGVVTAVMGPRGPGSDTGPVFCASYRP
jgi:hypothetical protein